MNAYGIVFLFVGSTLYIGGSGAGFGASVVVEHVDGVLQRFGSERQRSDIRSDVVQQRDFRERLDVDTCRDGERDRFGLG